METKPQISFIIVNHKSEKYILTCINSIKNNCSDFEIIIVNNDNSFFNSGDAKIINAPGNKGFGNACNLGAREARGKILCFLNPDTEIMDDIKKVVDYFDLNKEAGIIGPRLITEKNETQFWCAGRETSPWNLIRNNFGISRSKEIWESKDIIECDWISGACLFIRKELFDALNGFDENFFMYFEDEDLCQRARQKGWRVIYYPKFVVKHFGGKSFDNKFKQKKYFYKSMFYYFKKHLTHF